MASDYYVIHDDVVSSSTISALSTPYTMTPFANWLTNINEGGEKDMMGLYEVSAVDTKELHFFGPSWVIAKTEDRAKMKLAKKSDIDLDNDYIEFFVRCLGQWESHKPKEVKIVKEE